jgi:hypothetical protein
VDDAMAPAVLLRLPLRVVNAQRSLDGLEPLLAQTRAT